MATLTALDGCVQMISGDGVLDYSGAQGFVEELKEYSTASSHYTIISIIGPQSSGKSYLLNYVFGTNFGVLNATEGRKQTTKGIWIAKCVNPCMIIMDVEGSDGRERGEDGTLFERRSALFSLTMSDVLLLNMFFNNIGLMQGASYGLLKLIFEERVKIEAPKTTVIILVRDYDYETSTHIITNDLVRSMNENIYGIAASLANTTRICFNRGYNCLTTSSLWHSVHATTNMKMSDYINVIVKDFPHKSQKKKFAHKSKDLAKFLCSFAASGNLEQNHCASSFAYSSERIWGLICSNQRVNATDHKLAMSVHICSLTKNEILFSLDKEKEYLPLMHRTTNSVKEFHTKLQLFLKRILTRYEKETSAFDREKRKEMRDKLEEETLQVFKKPFKDNIVRLYYEKLSLAKPKVRGQLLKLAVRDRSSVIGVTHPYLAEFCDNLPADVKNNFKKILAKCRKEFEKELTKIAEEEAKKITEEEAYEIAQEKAKKIAEEQAKKLQLAESYSRCTEIKDELQESLLQETGHGSLESDTSMSVKEFNKNIQSSLKGILSSYDEKAGAFDNNIRKKLRDKLEEQTLQRFKPTFEAKIYSLSNEMLSLATCNVRGQLCKLPVLNRQSTLTVLYSYLIEFDENSCADVNPYFQEVLGKQREEFVEGLTRIAEKQGNKILLALRAAGAALDVAKLIIGTTWAVIKGDIMEAGKRLANGVRNIGDEVKDIGPDLLNSFLEAGQWLTNSSCIVPVVKDVDPILLNYCPDAGEGLTNGVRNIGDEVKDVGPDLQYSGLEAGEKLTSSLRIIGAEVKDVGPDLLNS